MQSKKILQIAVVSIFISLCVLGYSHYHSKKSSFAPEVKKEPTLFQPEAQIMTQSKIVKEDHEQEEKNALASAAADDNKTAEAKANVGPYVYDNGVCATPATTPYLCFAGYYRSLVRNYGSDTAFSDIKKRFKQNSTVVALCHPFMHAIGQEAATSYKTVSEAYLHGDSFCWSGYYHGILEGVIKRIGIQNLPAQINDICADIPGKASYNFDYYNCVHGLGHGIMEALADEVLDSLKFCDNLTGNWEQQSCYSGVYMENIIAGDNYGNGRIDTAYLKPSKPLYPCDIVATRYKEQCYLGQTSYALEVNNYDFTKIVPLCENVEQPYRDICFQSIGRDAANQALHDSQKSKTTCYLAAGENDRVNCVIGAVKEFVSYYHAVGQAKDFCTILDDTQKNMCAQTADNYFKVF